MSNRKKLIGSNKALSGAPINYKGHRIGTITNVTVIGNQIVVEVKLTHCYSCGKLLKHAAGIGQFCPNKKCEVLDDVGRFDLKEVY